MTRPLPVATPREAAHALGVMARRRPLVLTAAAAAFLLAALAGLVAPYALGHVVDVVREDGERSQVVLAVLVIAGAAVVGAVATALSVAWLAAGVEPGLAELREEVLDHAVHLDLERLEGAGSGDLVSRLGDDVAAVSEAVDSTVPLVIGSALAVVLSGAGLFVLDWRLGLAGLLTAPLYVRGLRWYLPRSAPYYRDERTANAERAAAVLTAVHAERTLRAYRLSERQHAEVERRSWRAAQLGIDVWHLLTRFFGRNNRAELVGLLLVLGTGFWLVRAEEVTVGAVTAAALLFHRLFNPIGALLTVFDEVQSAGASLVRLVGVTTARPVPVAVAATAGVELHAVDHAYVEGHPVLREVDLTVAPGERVALVGASGAGKSTLALVAAGLVAPTGGSVGTDGAALLVTQEVHTYVGTVREQLTLGRAADDDALHAALEAVGADGWVAALPDGLDTVVGEGGHRLTTAQAQHLALARVLVVDPPVVVLDEATAEAGSASARSLDAAADVATAGRAALVVAHRLSQAAQADRVVVLDEGRVVESGSHEQLVAAGGRYAALWGAWSGPETGGHDRGPDVDR